MKRISILVLVVLLFGSVQFGWSENSRTSSGVKEICVNFLEQISSGEYDDAFTYIKSHPHSIGEQEFSELEISTIQQSPTIKSLYGRALDIQLMKEAYASQIAMRLVYVIVREHLPVRWQFIYYKPEQEWVLVSILFDDDMEKLF
jgi:hypothetical protein